MWGVRISVGRGEGNAVKYEEVLENVGEVWESGLECGGGVGKHGEVCLGCGKCVGVGRGEKCGQRWGVSEDVGKGPGSVKKCGER